MDIKQGTSKKEWRLLFTDELISRGANQLERGFVSELMVKDNTASAVVSPRAGTEFAVTVKAPTNYLDTWRASNFSCTCQTKKSCHVRIDGGYRYVSVCQHEAAVLLSWEKEHGPWVFQEPPELLEQRRKLEQERLEKLERARQRKEEQAQQKAEQKRREAEKRRKLAEKLPIANFFPGEEPDGTFFNIKTAIDGLKTNQLYAEKAKTILSNNLMTLASPTQDFSTDGQPMLTATGSGKEPDGTSFYTKLSLLPDKVYSASCTCGAGGYYYHSESDDFCGHKLALLALLRSHIHRFNPGDATDKAAEAFFSAMDSYSAAPETTDGEQPVRSAAITLRPRLLLDDGHLLLSYKVGVMDGKEALLRSYESFLEAAEQHTFFRLNKTVALDFEHLDFTPDSLPWLTFLQRRMSETEIANRAVYGGYYGGSLKVKTRDELRGAMLDRFYELAEGGSVEFENKERKNTVSLRVEHSNLRVTLETARIPKKGAMQGVAIQGRMPVILKGSAGSYMLSDTHLSRITREEEQALHPFTAAADSSGNIRFQVGKERLAEYYYRVLPQLSQSPYVDITDACAEEAETLLPPEPRFRFRLDVDERNGVITCFAAVRYGEAVEKALPYEAQPSQYADRVQEQRVLQAIKGHFPRMLPTLTLHTCPFSEDALYEVMTEGVAELSRYGVVEGSEVFNRSALRPMPQMRVGVSVESGLLEIDLLTKDMSPEELLAVLESYRRKKRYHRLSSGAFVELERDSQLDELETISAGLDFSLEDAVRGGAKVPMYRALYLDSLLTEHDELVASRDRSYRALLKSFSTIRDADYEVPQAQAEVLRPYQVHGYKWLRTLAEAGFGGILADEMGLGKTLQFITLVQALRESGSMTLCLVVCPASLVYNWQEELTRFAPELNAQVMTGTAAARKSRIAALEEGTVCVTSYDLLRQDIAEYRKREFSLMVLDEAQYIKNQKAAMTKAVKAVPARLRFALTGTPIENRLAELWSIFDFLMPGFLYGYQEFSRRLETPIVKQKDPAATARLKQMTAPFILRRLKTDVLKDLPAKLEEVRYTRFEPEQRKVYDGQVVRMKQLVARSDGSGEEKLRIFAELTRIRQLCCDPSLLLEDYHGGSAKRTACLELIQNAIGGGHRMLVFSQFTSMLALLEKDLTEAGIPFYTLTGATPKEQRLRLVRQFNEGITPVFLISLKAGGTGLNLTGADVVIHYDPWWNLAAQNQATDRAHRIGQTRQVTVYKLIVKDTIEERILALQESKRDLAEAVLSGEGQSLASLSQEELLALLG